MNSTFASVRSKLATIEQQVNPLFDTIRVRFETMIPGTTVFGALPPKPTNMGSFISSINPRLAALEHAIAIIFSKMEERENALMTALMTDVLDAIDLLSNAKKTLSSFTPASASDSSASASASSASASSTGSATAYPFVSTHVSDPMVFTIPGNAMMNSIADQIAPMVSAAVLSAFGLAPK